MHEAYGVAQRAVADLKLAILMLLGETPCKGLTNADIGRRLGIYGGHKGHEGHVPRALLAHLEAEGLVIQDQQSKQWRLRDDTTNPS